MIEQEIRDTYQRHGIELAEVSAFSNGQRWSANSQYGYTLSEHGSQVEAERAVIDYYSERMNLIDSERDGGCGVSLTSADFEGQRCTNCGRSLKG